MEKHQDQSQEYPKAPASVCKDGSHLCGNYLVSLSQFERSPKWQIGSRDSLNKSGFGRPRNVPGPGQYAPFKSEFHPRFKSPPRIGFGIASRFPVEHAKPLGPGQYNPQDPILATSTNFSFGKEKRPSMGDRKGQSIPGPGTYFTRTNVTLGEASPKYSLRKICGLSALEVGKDRAPGPGSYQLKTTMSQLCPKYSFGKESRGQRQSELMRMSSYPGPGMYDSSYRQRLGNGVPRYSFGVKPKKWSSLINSEHASLVPGPGSYNSAYCGFGY